MSGMLLKNPTKKHEYSDDLESFLHVLCYVLIRFTPTSFTPEEIRDHISTVYDLEAFLPHCARRVSIKAAYFATGEIIPDIEFTRRTELYMMLMHIYENFHKLYSNPRIYASEVEKTRQNLNKVDEAFKKFSDLLYSMIEGPSSDWREDGPAIHIQLPESKFAIQLHHYVAIMRSHTSFHSSEQLSKCTPLPGGPDEEVEPDPKRRRIKEIMGPTQ